MGSAAIRSCETHVRLARGHWLCELAGHPPLRSAHHGKVAREYLLRRALQLALLNNVLAANPVRDVQLIRSTSTPTGAEALTADQLREPLIKLRVSETCAKSDLVDPIIRRGELTQRRKLPFPGEQSVHPARPRANRARCGCCDVGGRPGAHAGRGAHPGCLPCPAASGQPGRPGRASGSQVRRHPDIRLLSDIAVRAVEELDQRDIGTGKSRVHLPGARSIGPLLPGSLPERAINAP